MAPFFTSFLLRTISWKIILGDTGIILGPLKEAGILPDEFRLLATPIAVVSGITYNFLPFMTLPIYVSLEKIDKRLVEAAEDLFATRFGAFRRITFPLSLPGVFAGSLLTFIPAMGDYVNARAARQPADDDDRERDPERVPDRQQLSDRLGPQLHPDGRDPHRRRGLRAPARAPSS